MGAVYRAHDEVLDDEVALKILRPEVAGTPEMAARFRSEIKLARKVSHWNVCRIHEYGEEGGLQYISMELISGATLKDRLRAGPLPPDQAFDVSIQIAEGLAAIHKVGIIHRDLKSPNVMIDDKGTAKVMDFGIAKPASAGTDGASTGYVLGSPEYMSPEQARGRRADFRSDLYSLGIVVFEAFTGRVPFRGATPVETLMMHVEAPPPIDDPSLALPPALLPVLRSALAKDPAARFADAAAMAGALRAARGGAAGLRGRGRCVAYGGGPHAAAGRPCGGDGRPGVSRWRPSSPWRSRRRYSRGALRRPCRSPWCPRRRQFPPHRRSCPLLRPCHTRWPRTRRSRLRPRTCRRSCLPSRARLLARARPRPHQSLRPRRSSLPFRPRRRPRRPPFLRRLRPHPAKPP